MLEIALMRHGKVDIPEFKERIVGGDFIACLDQYDISELHENSQPDAESIGYFTHYSSVVCSHLSRSQESAKRLQLTDKVIIDPMFCEVKKPYLNFFGLKLYPKTWAILIGLSWYCGLLEKKMPFIEAKQRAKNCADKLEKLARDNGKVLLVGHGFMNTYIAKELRDRGWKGPTTPAKRHWQYGIYRL